LAVGGLLGVAASQGVILLLVPDIAATLGESSSRVGSALSAWLLGALLTAPFALRIAVGVPRRVLALSAGGLLAAVNLVGVAMTVDISGLAVAAFAGGAGSILIAGSGLSLLSDLYPPAARMRVVAASLMCAMLGLALSIILAVLVPQAEPLTWRGGLLLVALATVAWSAAVAGTREPAVGERESERVKFLLGDLNGAASTLEAVAPGMRFTEAVRRTHSVSSTQALLMASAGVGAAVYGLAVYSGLLLQERGPASRVTVAAVLAFSAVAAATAMGIAGPPAEAVYSRSPRGLSSMARWACLAGAVSAALLVLAGARGGLALQAIGIGGLAAALAIVAMLAAHLLIAVLAPELRSVGGLFAGAYAAVGAVASALLLPAVDEAGGLGWVFVAVGCTAAAAALMVDRATTRAGRDVEGVVEGVVEGQELTMAMARGAQAPLLSCRRVCFSYGQLQVLFDVDFTVDDGEMVALLGTNGAGKSTLLKVISGIGTPSSGAVRHQGRDITYMDPGQRVKRGITQIPGGKAVFGPLTVAENLRLYGYSLGRDRRTVDRGIEEGFAAFPRLAERRNAAASTMSGGEQQMLALTKALILKPRLLLIDELSLGLAPKVVGELLELVRAINATGAAVVLVEQSVNVALSLAKHAYFMEKGAVQFDGPAQQLLERPDVLRSVFLRGAAAGLAG